MKFQEFKIPIIEIKLSKKVKLFIKREDLIHPDISGNKYWKLFYNIKNYLEQKPSHPFIITFGGAYSNHIASTAAVGKLFSLPTLGIIRGEELHNSWQKNATLKKAHENGMEFQFVTRSEYRNKTILSAQLYQKFPNALVIPEGGTNALAVEGIANMLNTETKSFDYLCTAVGTGGTIAGISKFAEDHQQVLGFQVVADNGVGDQIFKLSGKKNYELIPSHFGGYGKISEENVLFINSFVQRFGIQLEPIYTAKMMMTLIKMIEENYFPVGSTILAFHTGGLQGIAGANEFLEKKGKMTIKPLDPFS